MKRVIKPTDKSGPFVHDIHNTVLLFIVVYVIRSNGLQ